MIDYSFLSFVFVWTISKSISVKGIDDKCVFCVFKVGFSYIGYFLTIKIVFYFISPFIAFESVRFENKFFSISCILIPTISTKNSFLASILYNMK